MRLRLLACTFGLIFGTQASSTSNELRLGLLFPQTGLLAGPQRAWASLMAIDHINRRDPTILGPSAADYTVNITWALNDTMRQAPVAVQSALWSASNWNAMGLVGPSSSFECEPVSIVAGVFNVPQISYSCTDAALSDLALYPSFYRVIPPDTVQGSVLAKLTSYFQWTRVGLISTEDSYSAGIADNYGLSAEAMAISVTRQTVVVGKLDTIKAALLAIQQAQLRIIVLVTDPAAVNDTLTMASEMGLTGPGYAWVGSDSVMQLVNMGPVAREAAVGLIGTDAYDGWGSDAYNRFYALWRNQSVTKYPQVPISPSVFSGYPNSKALLAWDSVVAYATAASKLIKQGLQLNGSSLQAVMSDPTFTFSGITTSFLYHGSLGDSRGVLALRNVQKTSDNNIVLVTVGPVGLDSVISQNLQNIIWSDRSKTPPRDSAYLLKVVSPGLNGFMYAVTVVAMCGTVGLMALVHVHRNHTIFRAHSAQLSQIILLACLVFLTNVFILAQNTDASCAALPFTIGIPVMITFGVAFGKMWRTHKIFLDATSANSLITDWQVLKRASFFVVWEILLDVVWSLTDRDGVKTIRIASKAIFYKQCGQARNFTFWTAFTMAVRGALLGYGVYLTCKTREVRGLFDERRVVLFAVYNTFALGLIFALFQAGELVLGHPDARFGLLAALVLLWEIVNVSVLFGLKLWHIRNWEAERGRLALTVNKPNRMTTVPVAFLSSDARSPRNNNNGNGKNNNNNNNSMMEEEELSESERLRLQIRALADMREQLTKDVEALRVQLQPSGASQNRL